MRNFAILTLFFMMMNSSLFAANSNDETSCVQKLFDTVKLVSTGKEYNYDEAKHWLDNLEQLIAKLKNYKKNKKLYHLVDWSEFDEELSGAFFPIVLDHSAEDYNLTKRFTKASNDYALYTFLAFVDSGKKDFDELFMRADIFQREFLSDIELERYLADQIDGHQMAALDQFFKAFQKYLNDTKDFTEKRKVRELLRTKLKLMFDYSLASKSDAPGFIYIVNQRLYSIAHNWSERIGLSLNSIGSTTLNLFKNQVNMLVKPNVNQAYQRELQELMDQGALKHLVLANETSSNWISFYSAEQAREISQTEGINLTKLKDQLEKRLEVQSIDWEALYQFYPDEVIAEALALIKNKSLYNEIEEKLTYHQNSIYPLFFSRTMKEATTVGKECGDCTRAGEVNFENALTWYGNSSIQLMLLKKKGQTLAKIGLVKVKKTGGQIIYVIDSVEVTPKVDLSEQVKKDVVTALKMGFGHAKRIAKEDGVELYAHHFTITDIAKDMMSDEMLISNSTSLSLRVSSTYNSDVIKGLGVKTEPKLWLQSLIVENFSESIYLTGSKSVQSTIDSTDIISARMMEHFIEPSLNDEGFKELYLQALKDSEDTELLKKLAEQILNKHEAKDILDKLELPEAFMMAINPSFIANKIKPILQGGLLESPGNSAFISVYKWQD